MDRFTAIALGNLQRYKEELEDILYIQKPKVLEYKRGILCFVWWRRRKMEKTIEETEKLIAECEVAMKQIFSEKTSGEIIETFVIFLIKFERVLQEISKVFCDLNSVYVPKKGVVGLLLMEQARNNFANSKNKE